MNTCHCLKEQVNTNGCGVFAKEKDPLGRRNFFGHRKDGPHWCNTPGSVRGLCNFSPSMVSLLVLRP